MEGTKRTRRGILLGLVVAVCFSFTPYLGSQQPMIQQFYNMVVDPRDGDTMWGVTRLLHWRAVESWSPFTRNP